MQARVLAGALACVLSLGSASEGRALSVQKILLRIAGRGPVDRVLVLEGKAYRPAYDGSHLTLSPLQGAGEIRIPVENIPGAGRVLRASGRVDAFAGQEPAGPDRGLDGRLSNEFPLDTAPVMLPPTEVQMLPDVAFDGSNYLVVWEDWRNDGDVYCARVAPDGTVLDPTGIPVSTAPGIQLSPVVTYDGSNFVVVWEDWRRVYSSDIYACRVTSAGVVLDPDGRVVCAARDDQGYPDIRYNGLHCLVVWEDWRSGTDIDVYASRVNSDLAVLDPGGFLVTGGAVNVNAPRVAAGNGDWLVTWARWGAVLQQADVYAARVAPDGTVRDAGGIGVSTADSLQYGPAASYDGARFLVAWTDDRNGEPDVYAARVALDGSVLDTAGIVVSTATDAQYAADVCHNGSDQVVVWEDGRSGTSDVYAARVTGGGTVIDGAGIAVSTATDEQFSPRLACDGTNSLVVWFDLRLSGDPDIYAARLTGEGSVLEPSGIALSAIANRQNRPAVAFDGTNCLAVWEDRRSGDWDIYACRFTPAGRLVDPVPFAVATGDGDQVEPAVAFDGSNYLVVWADQDGPNAPDIYGCRVTTGGSLLDPAGIEICAEPYEQSAPAVAFDGSNYLVVWQDDREDNRWHDIYASRVSIAGLVLDTASIAVNTAIGWQRKPAVCRAASGWFVVWEDHRNVVPGDIYGCRVGPDTTVHDPTGIPISVEPGDQTAPSVASDGQDFLVLWEDERWSSAAAVYCARVTGSATLLDPHGRCLASGLGDQTAPAVGRSGSEYVAAWVSQRGPDRVLCAARLNPVGGLNVLYYAGAQTRNELDPAVCGAGADLLVMTFPGLTGTHAGRAYNHYRAWAAVCSGSEPGLRPGWTRLEDMPPIRKRVKYGGGVAVVGDKVYALRGNNTREFYEYDIWEKDWRMLSEVPLGVSGRRVKRGGCITTDGYSVYIMKGNRTQEFYRYEPGTGAWYDLPQPNFIKGVKGGSMAFDGDRRIYLAAGSNNREWKVFDIFDETWSPCAPESLPTAKWKRGSFLAIAGNMLFGLRRGGKTNEFYGLNLLAAEPDWVRLQDMPLYNSQGRRKRAKDGASGSFDGQFLYAMKGGKTTEFFAYDILGDTWIQKLNVGLPGEEPRRKVKAGAGLAYSVQGGGFFALSGNNRNNFYFYLSGSEGASDGGTQAGPSRSPDRTRLTVSPNPARGRAVVRLVEARPRPPATARVYDALGRLVCAAELSDGRAALPVRTLAPGVYLVRVGDGEQAMQAKLVIAR